MTKRFFSCLLLTLSIGLTWTGRARANPLHDLAASYSVTDNELRTTVKKYAARINEQDNLGRTPLHIAVACFHRPTVAAFLNAGANPNIRDSRTYDGNYRGTGTISGYAPLHIAVHNRDRETAELLLAGGAAVNMSTQRGGLTPLKMALAEAPELVGLLISAGAGGKNAGEALLWAVAMENADAVGKLISSGVDVNAQFLTLDRYMREVKGRTALHQAAEGKHPRMVEVLLNQGVRVDVADERGDTPLHLAAAVGDPESVALLLDKGADPTLKDNAGATAAKLGLESGNQDVTGLMLVAVRGLADAAEPKPTPTQPTEEPRPTRADPAENVTRVYIDVRDTLNVPGPDGETWLHHIALSGMPEVLRNLLKAGGNPNARNRDGETPLHEAACAGLVTVAEVLVNAHADVNATCKAGRTPMHVAASLGRGAFVQFLIDKGASVPARDNAGLTPLHCAVLGAIMTGRSEALDVLLKAGADVNARDAQGVTPLGLVLHAKRDDLVDKLRRQGATE
ncbi:ankyrin repeat domain-containing protein [bacterium]|nr:ankyrin repeat domain-containing protein [bacterium]